MAILITEEKKQFNWLPFLIVGILLFAAAIGSYLLFFTEAPLIEYIAPSSQKRISDISSIKNDQFKNDIGSAKKELQTKIKQTAGSATAGVSNPGRTNPLLPF